MRVAAWQACGVHSSGFVSASMRAQAGRVGMILKGLGRGPDLYRERTRPTLESVSGYALLRAEGGRTLCTTRLLSDLTLLQGLVLDLDLNIKSRVGQNV